MAAQTKKSKAIARRATKKLESPVVPKPSTRLVAAVIPNAMYNVVADVVERNHETIQSFIVRSLNKALADENAPTFEVIRQRAGRPMRRSP